MNFLFPGVHEANKANMTPEERAEEEEVLRKMRDKIFRQEKTVQRSANRLRELSTDLMNKNKEIS